MKEKICKFIYKITGGLLSFGLCKNKDCKC